MASNVNKGFAVLLLMLLCVEHNFFVSHKDQVVAEYSFFLPCGSYAFYTDFLFSVSSDNSMLINMALVCIFRKLATPSVH